MAVGDVVEYLREHLALGYDIAELKLQLVRFGYSPKMVEEALTALSAEALENLPQPPLPEQPMSRAHIWLLTPVILFVLLFSISIIVSLLRNPSV